MGGGSKKETTQTQNTKSEPWEPAIPYLQTGLSQAGNLFGQTGLNDNENAAFNGLDIATRGGYNFSPQIAGLASDLFTGGKDRSGYVTQGYDDARGALSPIASQSTDPWSNTDFTKTIDQATSRALDNVKSSYTGAGIPAASYGDFAQNVGEGVSRVSAPLAWQARNDLVGQRTGAGKDLYSIGAGTGGLLSGMDQTALSNRGAGVGVAGAARSAQQQPFMESLNAEAMRRGIPMQNIASILNMILPIAGLGQQSEGMGTSTTWSKGSPLDQAMQVAGIGKTLFSIPNPFGGR